MNPPSQARWAVITGASSGIGAAILHRLARYDPKLNCLAVGRRVAKLEEVQRRAISDPSVVNGALRVHIVAADVSTPDGISSIVSSLPPNACVKYLIHNAGLLGPIAPFAEIDRSSLRDVIATNLEAPLFLTQALIPHLKRCAEIDDKSNNGTKARVLHVSSGAAHGSYEGWGPYCVTKAGLHMMYRCLAAELCHHKILVGSVRPGVVDTPMQGQVRGFDGPPDHFPAHKRFMDLKQGGKLESPERVAAYFHWLLSVISDDEFCIEEWDIRNSSKNDPRWNKFLSINSGST